MRADKPRRQAGVRDMLLSLGVIFAFIALGWPAFVNRETTSVRVIDFHEPLTRARSTLAFPLVSPEGLPTGWRATSAYPTSKPTGFHIGFVTPDNQYAVVEQSNAAEPEAISAVLGHDSVPGETATIAGASWQLRNSPGNSRALVRTVAGTTVIVTGTAGLPELQALAGSLR